MPDDKVIKMIRALARDECVNYRDGLCLETAKRCHLMHKDCNYFLEYILPSGWDMNDLEAYAMWYGADDVDDNQTEYS